MFCSYRQDYICASRAQLNSYIGKTITNLCEICIQYVLRLSYVHNTLPIFLYHMEHVIEPHRDVMVSVLDSGTADGSSPDRVKPKTIKLVFVASPLSTQH